MKSRGCNSPSPSQGGLACMLSDGSGRRATHETKRVTCNNKSCPSKQGKCSWFRFSITNLSTKVPKYYIHFAHFSASYFYPYDHYHKVE